MGRAGTALTFMLLVSLAVAVNGIYAGTSIEVQAAQNPGIDKLYDTGPNYTITRTENYDSVIYDYLNSSTLSTTNPDYYTESWSYTRTVLRFFKDLLHPAGILKTLPMFQEFPNTIIIWIISAIWDMIIALLFIEVIWRVNLFD